MGDVIDREIRVHGKRAFQGNQMNNQSAAKFVSSFTESLCREEVNCNRLETEREQGSSSGISNSGFGPGGGFCKTEMGHPDTASQPAYPFGTCIDDVYQNQLWTNREGGWYWVPKATALFSIDNNLGFPATAAEVRRFHPWSRKVVKARSQRVDGRSFAAVLKQPVMDRGREGTYHDQGGPWVRLGVRSGSGQYEEGREWHGEEERRAQDSYHQGEDRSHSSQKGDFRYGAGGSNSGEYQKGDFRSVFTRQFGPDYQRNDFRSGPGGQFYAESDRGGYNTAKRG